jgi:hypothetical protein
LNCCGTSVHRVSSGTTFIPGVKKIDELLQCSLALDTVIGFDTHKTIYVYARARARTHARTRTHTHAHTHTRTHTHAHTHTYMHTLHYIQYRLEYAFRCMHTYIRKHTCYIHAYTDTNTYIPYIKFHIDIDYQIIKKSELLRHLVNFSQKYYILSLFLLQIVVHIFILQCLYCK